MSKKRGFTLILTVLLIILLSIIALPLMSFFAEGLRSGVVDREVVQAKYMAYSGLYYGLYKYIADGTASGSYTVADNLRFTWDSTLAGDVLTIDSTGYSERGPFSARETFQATYTVVAVPVIPVVVTLDATNIGRTAATLNMTYDFKSYGSGSVRFAYRKQGTTTWTYTSWVSRSGAGTYSQQITGLTRNTWYEFYAQLQYDSTIIDGNLMTFRTTN